MSAELEWFTTTTQRLRGEIAKVLVGQGAVVDQVLTGLLADGHVLLEGVPGLGKTLLVQALAASLAMEFRRIQFTPDLMPADILGTQILEDAPGGGRRLQFREGPVFTQLLLADEINRATPKTQSALLEAMAERQVTVAGTRRPLPNPFFVLATQNPLDQEGTYPLPEAQLDRFLLKIWVPFPTLEELIEIMERTTGTAVQSARPVLEAGELHRLRRMVREVPVAPEVTRYAARLALASQATGPAPAPAATRYLKWGASPRGAQALLLAARVRALFQGRPHVAFADVRAVAPPALRHRLGLNFEAEAEGLRPEAVVAMLLDQTPEGGGPVRDAIR